MKARDWVVLSSLLLVAGCLGDDLFPEDRYGPTPATSSQALVSYKQQQVIIDYLVEATYGRKTHLEPVSNAGWYEVALTGYDFVDHRCDVYLDTLRVNSKRKTRAASLITATNAAAGSILQLTDVSRATIGIVAAAFGFASAFNDAYSESYLLSIGPGVVSGVIKKSRAAFREQVYEAQRSSTVINSRSAASSSIRSYLELCMPVFIEGQVSGVLADAKAVSENPTIRDEAAPATATPIIELKRE